ncbi:MAG TPA: ABC transporter ATP-binding protein [Vicinamibacterales bacterium]|nr:ABC transporter ATP-binding protein [Vicinamibacterales bacterium]
MSDVVLEIDGLVRTFGDVHAVQDVSFSVGRGQVLGFIGPNGAGKTTTMRIIATLDSPDAGDVRVGPYSVVDNPAGARQLVGFMPDYAGVYSNTTVEEYLDFFARAHDLRGDARRKAVAHIIEFMSIGDLRDRQVESLSKGLKQRVALGRAIIHDPEVLILDEPAANLDPRARIEFRTLIRELAADGKTILLSSHILTEMSEMCDAVTVIEKGRVLATGSVTDVLELVRKRRQLSVRAAGPLSLVERTLIEQPGVTNVHEAGDRLQFDFDGGDAEQVQLVGRLVAAGLPILEFRAHSADLEDLFIEITEGRMQ